MDREYSEINTFDKIICKHQNKFDNMQYLVAEDIGSRQWFIYNSNNLRCLELPFGEVVLHELNQYIAYDTHSIYHDDLRIMLQTLELQETITDREVFFDRMKEKINALIGFIGKISAGENIDKLEVWKEFRFMNYADIFSEMNDMNDNESAETRETMLKVINESHFVYHDIIAWTGADNAQHTGRCFVTNNLNNIFCWDLYHVLISRKVSAPHICERCGFVYFSNNNKTKYCSSCQESRNDIRNENRKKNPARYLHNRILSKLHFAKILDSERESFRLESNYYWDIVRGKEVKVIPEYRTDIITDEQYIQWLYEKLKSI